MAGVKGGADVVEIGHGRNVQPGARHRHDDVGESESQGLQQGDRGLGVGDAVADEVFAGYAKMHFARAQRGCDIGRRHQLDIDAGMPDELRAIVARARDLLQPYARIAKIMCHLFLQASFGGDVQDKGGGG